MRNRFMVSFAVCVLACVATAGTVLADTDQLTAQEMTFRSSCLSNLSVFNRDQAKLGSLVDLIIDGHSGQVMYGVLHTGIGGKYIPVPWNVFRIQKSGDNHYALLLNMSKEQLAGAPTVERNQVPDITDQRWRQSIDKFFGVQTVARPSNSDEEDLGEEFDQD